MLVVLFLGALPLASTGVGGYIAFFKRPVLPVLQGDTSQQPQAEVLMNYFHNFARSLQMKKSVLRSSCCMMPGQILQFFFAHIR